MVDNRPYGTRVDYRVREDGHIELIGDLGTMSKIKQLEARKKAYRQEASKQASIANKRLQRLEQAGLLEASPAVRDFLDGKRHFGVRGKNFNQVQKELSEIRGFLNSMTSTVTGAKTWMKETADNVGIDYNSLDDLKQAMPRFFELTDKVQQYMDQVQSAAASLGYREIWETISRMVNEGEIDLTGSEDQIDGMLATVTEALEKYPRHPVMDRSVWFPVDD